MIWMRHIGFWCEKLCAWKICRILASLMKLAFWIGISDISQTFAQIVLDMGGVKRNQGQWYDEPTSSENKPRNGKKIKFNSVHHPGVEPGSRAWKAHILTVGLMERAHNTFQITWKYTNVLLLLKHECFIRDFCKLQCPEGLKGLNILNLNSNLHSHHWTFSVVPR